MNGSPVGSGAWQRLCTLALVATVTASPTMMTAVMDRGHEIPKLMVAVPLAMLALAAAIVTLCWRGLLRSSVPTLVAAIALLVFVCVAGASTATSALPTEALFGGFFRLEGLVAWISYAAIFFALLAWTRNTGLAQGFVDAMILGSVIPACYALQQSFNLDFYDIVGRDPSRANGTQGNPVQLAEYLSLMIPVSIARVLQSKSRFADVLPWAAVLGLQVAGLWVTQTRGPLFACLAGLTMLGMFWAALARRRSWFIASAGPVVAGLLVLVAINVLPPARSWAQTVPFLGRMVFDVGRDAGASTSLASRSILARLGIWEAGAETFAASAPARQLFGFGPESAYLHYYAHIPRSVIRSEDYRTVAFFDRLHADALDIGLNFGLVGWLAYLGFFCAVIFVAARGMFGAAARVVWRPFVMLTSASAVTGGALASVLGFPYATVPAACLGIGAGWMLFLGIAAWGAAGRHIEQALPTGRREDWILVAGMTVSLLVFWIDAQINIPLLTSRIVSFAFAALILGVLGHVESARIGDDGSLPMEHGRLVDWGLACAFTAACASFLPVLGTDQAAEAIPAVELRLIPLGVLALVAFAIVFCDAYRSFKVRSWTRVFAIFWPCLMYSAVHLLFRISVDAGYGPGDVTRVAALVAFGPAFIAVLCFVLAFSGPRGSGLASVRIAPARIVAASGSVLLGCLTFFVAWKAQVADIAATSSRWAIVREQLTGDQLIAVAVASQPYEWQYRRMEIRSQLGQALAALEPGGLRADRHDEFKRRLGLAEAAARDAVRLGPDNPWPLISLANVLQVRALKLVRDHDRVGGESAEQEADKLFGKAAQMFPVQPVIYRNWAQLKFDGGFPEEGYRLLDTMESIIPDEPEAYIERILMARRFGHLEEATTTADRAARRLSPEALAAVQVVAKTQQ